MKSLLIILVLSYFTLTNQAPQQCSVFGMPACACYNDNHCTPGRGCLTPRCNKDACAFPRICFCRKERTGGSNCWPVQAGPCKNCGTKATFWDTFTKMKKLVEGQTTTPVKVLEWEYGTLDNEGLISRLIKLNLKQTGTRKDFIQRLVDYTINMEKKSLKKNSQKKKKKSEKKALLFNRYIYRDDKCAGSTLTQHVATSDPGACSQNLDGTSSKNVCLSTRNAVRRTYRGKGCDESQVIKNENLPLSKCYRQLGPIIKDVPFFMTDKCESAPPAIIGLRGFVMEVHPGASCGARPAGVFFYPHGTCHPYGPNMKSVMRICVKGVVNFIYYSLQNCRGKVEKTQKYASNKCHKGDAMSSWKFTGCK